MNTLHCGDALTVLRSLPSQSVQCCVTSPPYFGLRDYGVDGQIGLEETPDEYVSKLVAVFREVRRVLKDDGTLWLNLGDSYAGGGGGNYSKSSKQTSHGEHITNVRNRPDWLTACDLKPKDLIGIPWRVAFALQADGWYLRSDIIWSKPNCMPESVKDRPTKSHEYVFLLTTADRYFYDLDSIVEPAKMTSWSTKTRLDGCREQQGPKDSDEYMGNSRARVKQWSDPKTRNSRSVWEIATKPFRDAHFATMPVDLAERCVKAGSKEGDTVLDPFAGAGTTGVAASRLGRSFVGIELNPDYCKIAQDRISVETNKTSLFQNACV